MNARFRVRRTRLLGQAAPWEVWRRVDTAPEWRCLAHYATHSDAMHAADQCARSKAWT